MTEHGSGCSENVGYKLEVRTSYPNPTRIGDFIIDGVWRVVPISGGVVPSWPNIPVSARDSEILGHGLVSRYVAEAHRWALLALMEANRSLGSLCIETRLVRIKYATTYSLREEGVSVALKAGDAHQAHARSHNMSEFLPRAEQDKESLHD
jgi:hypothetical protein